MVLGGVGSCLGALQGIGPWRMFVCMLLIFYGKMFVLSATQFGFDFVSFVPSAKFHILSLVCCVRCCVFFSAQNSKYQSPLQRIIAPCKWHCSNLEPCMGFIYFKAWQTALQF